MRGIDGGLIRGPLAEGLGRVISEPVADAGLLQALLDAGCLPVMAPMGLDPDGRTCNVNADDAAAAVSASLGGELVLMTDTDGVRDAHGERIPELTPDEAARLIETGRHRRGHGAQGRVRTACAGPGVAAERAVIADGRAAGALRRALHEGAGTTFRNA